MVLLRDKKNGMEFCIKQFGQTKLFWLTFILDQTSVRPNLSSL